MIKVLLAGGDEVELDFASPDAAAAAEDAVLDVLIHADGSARDLERELASEADALGMKATGSGGGARRIVVSR